MGAERRHRQSAGAAADQQALEGSSLRLADAQRGDQPGFGPTDLSIEPPYGQYAHFHTGIDLAAPELTPVLAADDGTVALVGGGDYGYGNYVVIAHLSGLVSLYGHLNRSLVHVGDVVTQGQRVGLEGSSGHSTGPHLHFEVRQNNVPVNPAIYLPPGAPSSLGLNGA